MHADVDLDSNTKEHTLSLTYSGRKSSYFRGVMEIAGHKTGKRERCEMQQEEGWRWRKGGE